MTLEGWKSIAAELVALWGRSVSEWTAQRYADSRTDPLPVMRIRGRVVARLEDVRTWAQRQIR